MVSFRLAVRHFSNLPKYLPHICDVMHTKICNREGHPYLSQSELKAALHVNAKEAYEISKLLYGRDGKSIRPALLRSLSDLRDVNHSSTYTPLGTTLSNSFLEWCGGCFDGDGCVTTERDIPVLSIQQNNFNVKLFQEAFGGSLYESSKGQFGWKVRGIRAYLVAKILVHHTSKKNCELGEVVRYHECSISIPIFRKNVRQMKDEYHLKSMDVSEWSYPRLAGWVDSDGTITFMNQKYPAIIVYQNNVSMCQSLKDRFGGTVANQKTCFFWRVVGAKAIKLLVKIHPFLIHKKLHSETIMNMDRLPTLDVYRCILN